MPQRKTVRKPAEPEAPSADVTLPDADAAIAEVRERVATAMRVRLGEAPDPLVAEALQRWVA